MGSSTVQSDPDGTRVYPYDPDKAKAYLQSGGYDGTPVKIIYDVTDPYQSANSTALKQDLEAVGFTVDLKGLQSAEFFGVVYDPTARDISSTYWSADYPDAQDYFSTNFICGSGLNISHFCDESIDADLAATETMAEIALDGPFKLIEIDDDKYFGRVVADVVTASGLSVGDWMLGTGLVRPYDGGARLP